MGCDWHQLAVESHYRTAVGVKEALEEGDLDGALRGIDELIDAMGRSDRRAVRSQLIRLMQHIINGTANLTPLPKLGRDHCPCAGRDFGHAGKPSITDDCYGRSGSTLPARQTLRGRETRRSMPIETLPWHDVFDPATLCPPPGS